MYEPTAADWLALADLSVELGLGDLDPETQEAAGKGNVQALIKTFGSKWAKGPHPHAACTRALAGKVSDPAALCAWLKDRATGTTKWRGKESGHDMKARTQTETQTITESLEIRSVVEGTQGREWELLIIRPGVSKNGIWYEPQTLKSAAPLYEGAVSYDRHGTGEARSFKERIGRIHSAVYDTREGDEGLWGRLRVIDPGVREKLLEAVEAGELHTVGFSHDVLAEVEPVSYQGRKVKKAKRIESVNSVDMVERPSAGGRMARLVAGDGDLESESEGDMDPEEIKAAIAESVAAAMKEASASFATAIREAVQPANQTTGTATQEANIEVLTEASGKAQEAANDAKQALREATKERQRGVITRRLTETKLTELSKTQVMRRFEEWLDRRLVEDNEIEDLVREQIELEAVFQQSVSNPNVPNAVRFQMGKDSHDKFRERLYATLAGPHEKLGEGIEPFHSLKAAYIEHSGNWDVSAEDLAEAFVSKGGYRSNRDHKRITESITTATFADVFNDVMYQRLIAAYRANPWYDEWRKFCSEIISVPDFRVQHMIRVGGYGDLPAVGEGATYTTTTSPDDEEVEFAVSKRGMLEDITWEATVNDQVGSVRRIPNELGRAAARTLYKFVLNMITTDNPTLDYDATALYHANHANTGTTALTISGLYAVQVAMRDQTGFSMTSEILGPRNKVKYLVVPNELTGRADRIVNPSDQYLYSIATPADTETVMDPTMFKGQGIGVHTYDNLTDATDWWAVADPTEVPTLAMGFLGGRQEPELFVQDQPQNGSVMTADKITYKIRHVYGGDILDHRSFYRQVVA